MATSLRSSGQHETFTISELELNVDSLNSEVFVVFQLGTEKLQTPAISSSRGVWGNDTWTLTPTDGSTELEAVVYQKQTLRHDAVLGFGRHHIRHAQKQGKLTIPLQSKQGGSVGNLAFYLHSSTQSTQGSYANGGGSANTFGSHGSSGSGGILSGAREATGYSGTSSSQAQSGTSRGITSGLDGLHLGQEQAATRNTGATTSITGQANQPVCEQKYYTKIEDRPQVREVVTTFKEHHPIEKEFITETRPTGREQERMAERTSEARSGLSLFGCHNALAPFANT
eukprot:jgi/Astpho2/3371/Aster-04713